MGSGGFRYTNCFSCQIRVILIKAALFKLGSFKNEIKFLIEIFNDLQEYSTLS